MLPSTCAIAVLVYILDSWITPSPQVLHSRAHNKTLEEKASTNYALHWISTACLLAPSLSLSLCVSLSISGDHLSFHRKQSSWNCEASFSIFGDRLFIENYLTMEWSSPWGCSLHRKQLAMEWSSPCPLCWIRCQVELP